MPQRRLNVIANTHMDPVWLWDRSAGRNSWNSTIQSVVRMMTDFPEITFSCSTTAMYRWIEETDTGLFTEIQELVRQGRWEIVGGWEVESDTIISRYQTLIKQAEYGKSYIRDRFGVDVRIAYNVDAFGHTAGLPSILRETGYDYYVYCRSQETPPLFRWRDASGAMVVALRLNGYGYAGSIAKDAFIGRLKKAWEQDVERPLLMLGVGNHGGGIFRRHMAWLNEAAQEIPIHFSTFGEFFAGIEADTLSTLSGELGPVFRGCYSACHPVKNKVAAALERMTVAESLGVPSEDLHDAWRELLFHHFHDILPGTSVRRAYERDVLPGLGMVEHTANVMIDRELARRNASTDTRFMPEGGVQIWNPHAAAAVAIVAVDGFTDPNNTGSVFNVLRTRDGAEFPLQTLPAATSYGPCNDGWGRLTAVVPLAGLSEKYLAYARSTTVFQNQGFERQRELLYKLSLVVCYDDSRTWGFGLESFDRVLGEATEQSVEEYQDGPVCSILRVRYTYKRSTIAMDLVAYAGVNEIEIRLNLDWLETECCLKLALAHGQPQAAFFTGGAATLDRREPQSGERAFIDWCCVEDDRSHTGFYAADLHGCDNVDNQLRLTLLRPTLYADHAPFEPATEDGWQDLGQIQLRCWFFSCEDQEIAHLPGLARRRLLNPETHEVTTHDAGAPHATRTPLVTTSSATVVTIVGPAGIYACNYGDTDESIAINGTRHLIAAKSIVRFPGVLPGYPSMSQRRRN